MKKEFVPHKLSVKLKELGFEDDCMAYYSISLTEVEHEEDGTSGPFGWKQGEVTFEKRFFVNNYKGIDGSNENWLESAAPLYQQAFRWFREKYFIHGEPKYKGGLTKETAWYDYIIISNIDWNDSKIKNKQYKTYEEAELACLEKLIEIIEGVKE
jgi:hypothetical protein